MNKEWAEIVKEKLDSFVQRETEIETTLNELITDLESKKIFMRYGIKDEESLVWEIKINNQRFFISEDEVSKKQIIEGIDDHGITIDTGQRISVKEALQNLIIEKLKSF
jgi:hypothetical protein